MTEYMERKPDEKSKITISDVAEALEVSVTTVSRAISGKGRIGAQTREKVLQYIEEHNYQPNIVAKGLNQSKTYNIGWVIPEECHVVELPFFQDCMMGIAQTASAMDYNLIVLTVMDNDISQLTKLIANGKVDGVILGRTLVEDAPVNFLQSMNVPFITIGTAGEGILQIDNDHRAACRELTKLLLLKNINKLGLIGGNTSHIVTQNRYRGFMDALEEAGMPVYHDNIFLDMENGIVIEHAVEELLAKKVECILCMDDSICSKVLTKLGRDGIAVPGRVKLASFYNSKILENSEPSITSLSFPVHELGMTACRLLLDYLAGRKVPAVTRMGYEISLKESTK